MITELKRLRNDPYRRTERLPLEVSKKEGCELASIEKNKKPSA